MSEWRLATSLKTLLNEVNTLAPNRSKASDGTIGDAAHAARPSRHNPNNANVVCALDITSDPANGMPIHDIAESIRVNPNKHPELEYIISHSRIASKSSEWEWRPYNGLNPHDKHVHFAVGLGPDSEPTPPYDSTQTWNLSGEEVDDVSKEDVHAALEEDAIRVFGIRSHASYLATVLDVARKANDNAVAAKSNAAKANAAATALNVKVDALVVKVNSLVDKVNKIEVGGDPESFASAVAAKLQDILRS